QLIENNKAPNLGRFSNFFRRFYEKLLFHSDRNARSGLDRNIRITGNIAAIAVTTARKIATIAITAGSKGFMNGEALTKSRPDGMAAARPSVRPPMNGHRMI